MHQALYSESVRGLKLSHVDKKGTWWLVLSKHNDCSIVFGMLFTSPRNNTELFGEERVS